ncbi:hypothetical protein ILYODFUR_011393 [Ilyodon furcidens]|uniref:Uncharacterized protein n=1 Tax=Ilyodon furcidens TaxID=33524 RepID=A0ABV0TTR0_9TELE
MENELRTKRSSELSVTPSTRRSLMKRKRRGTEFEAKRSRNGEPEEPEEPPGCSSLQHLIIGFSLSLSTNPLPILHSRPLTLLITPPARALIGCVEVFT